MKPEAMQQLCRCISGRTTTQQAVLWQLVASTNGAGQVSQVGQEKISANVGVSVRTVQRALLELEKKGILSPAGFSSFGVKRWRILTHAGDALAVTDDQARSYDAAKTRRARRGSRHSYDVLPRDQETVEVEGVGALKDPPGTVYVKPDGQIMEELRKKLAG